VPADCYLADDSNTNIEVLFVVDVPASGKSLVGRTDEFLLKRILARLAPETSWGVSSLIRCSPCTPTGDPRRPKADEFQRCRRFLDTDIQQQRPRVVVGLGEVAAAHVGAPPERGHWRRTDRYIAVNTWHPETVGRSKKMVPMFYRDIEMAFRLARGHVPPDAWGQIGRSRLLRRPSEVRETAELIANLTGYCAVDVETHNLNKRYGNALAMIQFAWSDDDAVCIPLHHPQNPMTPDEIQETRQILRDLFVGPTRLRGWLAHFGKFEQTQIGRDILTEPNGVTETFRNAPMLDTGALAYLLDENASNFPHSYALKSLARSKLGFYHYDDATLTARSSGSLIDLPLESPVPVGNPGWVPNLTDYGGMDAYVTYRLFQALCGEADQQDYLVPALRLLRRFFSPVFGLLSVIERNGFWANLDYLRTIKDPQTSPIVGRLREIDTHLVPQFPSAQRTNEKLALQQSGGTPALFGDTPWVMDLQKDAHVRAWLVDECGLEPLGYGKAGFASVDSAFFEHHRDHEEVALVEERRGLAKLASAYLKQITGYIDPSFAHKTAVATARQLDCRDGRIRCDIHLTSTTTGRASAANPNMQQQVRSDTEAKAAIKNIFQAEQPDLQDSFQIDFTKGPPRMRTKRPPTNALVQLDFMANEVRWLCGTGDTLVATDRGLQRLDELCPTSGVHASSGVVVSVDQTARMTTNELTHVGHVGKRDALRLSTTWGYHFAGGVTHEMMVWDSENLQLSFQEIQNIRPGDIVVIAADDALWPTQLDLAFDPATYGTETLPDTVTCPDCCWAGHNLASHYNRAHGKLLDGRNALSRTAAINSRTTATATFPTCMTVDLAELIGLMVSEGHIGHTSSWFTNKERALVDHTVTLVKRIFCVDPTVSQRQDDMFNVYLPSSVGRFLHYLGVSGRDVEKVLPWSIRQAPRACVVRFLRGLWDGDGNVHMTCCYDSASESLVRDLQILVLRLGIVAKLGQTGSTHRLMVTGANAARLQQVVGSKRSFNDRTFSHGDAGIGDHIPGLKQYVDRVKLRSPGRRQSRYVADDGTVVEAAVGLPNACRRGYTAKHALQILPFLRRINWDVAARVEQVARSNLRFAVVEKVEPIGAQNLYDITVVPDHNYVGNGFVNHNCVMSRCPNLAKAFNEGKAARDAFRANPTDELRHAAKVGGDIHKQTASIMFGVPIDQVDKQRRTATKSIVFGLLYGRGVHALAAQLHKDVEEAQALMDKFCSAFPIAWEWIQRQPTLARDRGYVESPIGRRRRLYGFLVERPDINDMSKPDRQLLGETKRMAMNSGIQGVASDASFIGSALFSEHIQRHRLPWLIQNVVHDSCVYQVPLAQVEESIAVAEQMFTTNTMRYMEQHWGVVFNCPIEVEFEIGLRWGALMEWDFTAPSMQHIIQTLRAMEV